MRAGALAGTPPPPRVRNCPAHPVLLWTLIADYFNNRVREVSNGVFTTVAGNGAPGFGGDGGPAPNALLSQPNAVAVDSSGNLDIADNGNYRVRKVSNGMITTRGK